MYPLKNGIKSYEVLFHKNAFLSTIGEQITFVAFSLLRNLLRIKRSCSVYRQVLKNIQVHSAV